jgi:diguanylate cyclase (GGDEF)-like protein
MDLLTGLIIQFAGIFLVASLFVFLTKSLRSDTIKYWKTGWLSLSFAHFCLIVAFNSDSVGKFFLAFYYLGSYIFAYFLIVGCANLSYGEKTKAKHWYLLIPAAIVSTALAIFAGDYNVVFNLHTFLMAAFFGLAFFALRTNNLTEKHNIGWRVMKFALAFLAFDFFHYTIVFSLAETSFHLPLPKNFLTYNAIVDLVLEVMLGFGMIIVLMEKVRLDMEEINHKLKEANEKLKKLANVDPLTTAFTRHAFYSFLQKHDRESGKISGCVGVFDIDNLKPINDRFGHSIGDVAISKVSHTIRSLIRSDDLIFRWGGDEFFVVMIGFDTGQAIERMCYLNKILENVRLQGLSERITIGVSFGFADFNEVKDLEKAIEKADAEMYLLKQQNKCQENEGNLPLITQQITPEEASSVIH